MGHAISIVAVESFRNIGTISKLIMGTNVETCDPAGVHTHPGFVIRLQFRLKSLVLFADHIMDIMLKQLHPLV